MFRRPSIRYGQTSEPVTPYQRAAQVWDGVELGADSEDDLVRALRRGAQDTINQSGQQIVGRQLGVQPTLTIRPGHPLRVILTRDLILEPIGAIR